MKKPLIKTNPIPTVTASLLQTLEPVELEEPWGPYYFQYSLQDTAFRIYNSKKEEIYSNPLFGYMVSAEAMKRFLVLENHRVAAKKKIKLLENKSLEYDTSIRQFILYTNEVEAENSRLINYVTASGAMNIVLILLLIAL